MRKLLVAILVLAVLVLGTPFFIGLWVEHNYPKEIQLVLQKSPNLSLQIQDLKRSWFSTHVDALVTDNATHFTASFQQTILHGPIVLYRDQDGQHIAFAKAAILTNFAKSSGFAAFESSTLLNWRNELVSHYLAKEVDYQTGLYRLVITNLKGYGKMKLNGDRASARMRLGQVEITPNVKPGAPATIVTLHDLSLKAKVDVREGIWLGAYQVQLNSADVKTPKSSFTAIKDLNFKVAQNARDHKISSSVVLKIADQNYPLAKIQKLDFSLGLNNLDYSAMQAFSAQFRQASAAPALAAAALPGAMLGVVSQGFTMDTQLTMGYNQDPIAMTFNTNLPPLKQPSTWQAITLNLVAKGHACVPMQLVKDALTEMFASHIASLQASNPQQKITLNAVDLANKTLNEWVARKMLIVQGAEVCLDFTLKQGQSLVNGQTIDFSLPASATVPSVPVAPTPASVAVIVK